MLKAFLGTLILVFILSIYLLPKQDSSNVTLSERNKVQRQSVVNKKNDTSNVVISKVNHEGLQERKVSSEGVLKDFYKESSQAVVKQSIDEAAFLSKYQRVASGYFNNTQEEKWSIFRDIHITLDKNSETLLPFGPYRITDKPTGNMPAAKLIYNEDQKIFAIITGRLIAKLKNLFDEERISKDYELEIESVNTDIKTVFYKLKDESSISEVRKLLNSDPRIDSFYFETVHNQWQKN